MCVYKQEGYLSQVSAGGHPNRINKYLQTPRFFLKYCRRLLGPFRVLYVRLIKRMNLALMKSLNTTLNFSYRATPIPGVGTELGLLKRMDVFSTQV